MPLASNVKLEEVAQITDNFSGADLANVMREVSQFFWICFNRVLSFMMTCKLEFHFQAGFCALSQETVDDIKQEHIIESLAQVRSSLKYSQLHYQELINK